MPANRPPSAGPSDPSDIQPAAGDVVGGRYRVLDALGRGGMGAVYRAEHTRTGGLVALKVLHADRLIEPRHRQRFELEARNAAVLQHSNTVRVFDYGVDEQFVPALPYIAMELVDGRPLSAVIASAGALPWRRAVAIARQVLTALGEAHEHPRHIVHRDIKPSNILLVDELGGTDRVKVVDFGVARALARGGDSGAERAGSPATMAPEVWRGERIGPGTDLYSLGCTIYEMLAGAPPFETAALAELMRCHCSKEPRPLQAAAPHPVPDAIAAWVGSLLQKEPRRRPSSAREVIARLDAAVAAAGESLTLATPAPADRPDVTLVEALDRVTLVESQELVDTATTLVSATPMPSEPRTNLPPAFTRFIGRQREREKLSELFDRGARLVTVHGPGGTGKTRLCREWGRAHVDRFAGGVWFCDLTEAITPDGLAAAVASELGLSLSAGSPTEQLGHALRERGEALLILDNLEQVIEPAAAAVRTWLDAAPETRFLATSRDRLDASGEHVLTLDSLALPLPDAIPADAAAALRYEAIELFVDRAQASHRAYHLRDDEVADVAELVRQLDGMPLAIELAARRVRVLRPKGMLAKLSRRFDLLKARGEAPDRHATLQATIDWSWSLLDGPEQHALSQCAIFRGGFDIDAAEAVLDLSAWPESPWAVDLVESLCDKSLLRILEGPGGEPRFGMFVSVQAYAAAKLADPDSLVGPAGEPLNGPGAQTELARRHAAHYAGYGSRSAMRELGRDPKALPKLVGEVENLWAACQQGLADVVALPNAARAYRALDEVARQHGPVQLAVDIGQTLAQRPELSAAERVHVLLRLVWSSGRVARIADAEAWIGEAERLLDAAPHEDFSAQVAGARAYIALQTGRLSEAVSHATTARVAAQRTGEVEVEERALWMLMEAHRFLGDIARAARAADERLALGERSGDRLVMASSHYCCGIMQTHAEAPRPRPHYEAALRLAREMGHRGTERWTLHHLATAQWWEGEASEALVTFRRVLSLTRRDGDRRLLGFNRLQMALLELELGRLELVEAQLGGLSRQAEVLDEPHLALLTRELEARLRWAQRDWDRAAEATDGLETLGRELGSPRAVAVAEAIRGHAAYARGDLAEASARYTSSMKAGEDAIAARSGGYLGVTLLAQGQLDAARSLVDRAEEATRQSPCCTALAIALAQRALVDGALGCLDEAEAACAEARGECLRIDVLPASEAAQWVARAEETVAAAVGRPARRPP